MQQIIEKYAYDVLEGKIPAGKYVRKSIERHFNDLNNLPGYSFDVNEALRHVEFFSLLKHFKGAQFAGKTFELAPWQAWLVYCFFGWKRPDGLRRFETLYCEVAKKQGKTSLMAGLALDHLIFGDEAAEVYTCAKARHQARICLDETRGIAKRSPAVSKYLKIGQHGIVNPRNGGKMVALASDSSSLDGLNPSMLIFDEVHSYSDFDLVDVLTSGNVARLDKITAMITTAGTNRLGPGYQFREVCRQVLEGVVKREDLFAIIYTLDEDDDWKDEKVWVKSMPSLGYTVRVEEIRTKAQAAATQTSQLNSFLTKNMNIWLSSQTAWIDDETWMLCDKGLVDPKILEGCPCWAGMDLSWKSDYTALVLLFDLGGELVLQSHFWATENELKSVEDVFDVWQWVNGGHLNVHEGDLLNYEVMGEEMGEILLRYQPQRIGFDPAAFSALYQKLLQLGVNEQVFDKVIQGTLSMTPGIQALETAIRNQEVNHQGHPVLRWMVQNVELYSDGKGLINFRKGSNNALKIDGCHGAAMAFEAKRRVEIQEVPDEPLSYTPRILPGHLNF